MKVTMRNKSKKQSVRKIGRAVFSLMLSVVMLLSVIPLSADAAWVSYDSTNTASVTVEYVVKYYHNGVYQPNQDDVYGKDTGHTLSSASVTKADLNLKKYPGMMVEKVMYACEIVTSYPIMLSKGMQHTIEVYYVDDLFDYTDICYTINYYQAGNTTSTPDDITTRTVRMVNGRLTTTVRQNSVETTKYDYQLFDADASTALPIKVKDGDSIDIRYKKDETQVVEGSYTIQYMKEGVPADKIVVKKDVWAGDADLKLITVEKSDFDRNQYAGYLALAQAEISETFAGKVTWGTVVEANYQRDDSQKEDFTYGYNLYYGSEDGGYHYLKTEWFTYEDMWIGEEKIVLTQDGLKNYRDAAGRIVIPAKDQLIETDDLFLSANSAELVIKKGKTANVYYDYVQQASIVLKGTIKASSNRLNVEHFPIGVVEGECTEVSEVFLTGEVLPTGIIEFTLYYINEQEILGKELDFVIKQVPSASGIHEKKYIWDTSEYTVRVKFTQSSHGELEAVVVGSVSNISFMNFPK